MWSPGPAVVSDVVMIGSQLSDGDEDIAAVHEAHAEEEKFGQVEEERVKNYRNEVSQDEFGRMTGRDSRERLGHCNVPLYSQGHHHEDGTGHGDGLEGVQNVWGQQTREHFITLWMNFTYSYL